MSYRKVKRALLPVAAIICQLFVARVANAQTVQPVVWMNLSNAVTTGSNNNGLQKSGGCEGCLDSGGNSQQTIASGDGYFEFTATETNRSRYLGLSNIATHDYHQIQLGNKSIQHRNRRSPRRRCLSD